MLPNCRLYDPVHEPPIAFATLGPTDRKRLVLPDAEFHQFVTHERRHIHHASVGERVHHLVAEAALALSVRLHTQVVQGLEGIVNGSHPSAA